MCIVLDVKSHRLLYRSRAVVYECLYTTAPNTSAEFNKGRTDGSFIDHFVHQPESFISTLLEDRGAHCVVRQGKLKNTFNTDDSHFKISDWCVDTHASSLYDVTARDQCMGHVGESYDVWRSCLCS